MARITRPVGQNGPSAVNRLRLAANRSASPGGQPARYSAGSEVQQRGPLVAAGSIKVCEALADGDRAADRHEVTVTRRDGTVSRIEVYLFGELADDGRLRRAEEIIRVLSRDADDARLARVR